jgi:hypothetical protein
MGLIVEVSADSRRALFRGPRPRLANVRSDGAEPCGQGIKGGPEGTAAPNAPEHRSEAGVGSMRPSARLAGRTGLMQDGARLQRQARPEYPYAVGRWQPRREELTACERGCRCSTQSRVTSASEENGLRELIEAGDFMTSCLNRLQSWQRTL